MDHCTATNKNGTPCRARPRPNRSYCWAHDDELTERRAARNRAGGKAKSHTARAAKRVPSDLRAVLEELYETLAELRAGTLPKGRAMEVAALCRAIVAVYEVGAVEAELAALETTFKERRA